MRISTLLCRVILIASGGFKHSSKKTVQCIYPKPLLYEQKNPKTHISPYLIYLTIKDTTDCSRARLMMRVLNSITDITAVADIENRLIIIYMQSKSAFIQVLKGISEAEYAVHRVAFHTHKYSVATVPLGDDKILNSDSSIHEKESRNAITFSQ